MGIDKRHLYEHDIRVPMLVRGPGVPKNLTLDEIVLNIDMAPTIVELITQSKEISSKMDGRNFMSLFSGVDSSDSLTCSWRSDFLVSYHGEGHAVSGMFGQSQDTFDIAHPQDSINNTYNCLRTMVLNSSSWIAISSDVDEINAPTGTNTVYCQFKDDESFVEFYDLSSDPWQLNNRANELTTEERLALTTRMDALKACSGKSCRV